MNVLRKNPFYWQKEALRGAAAGILLAQVVACGIGQPSRSTAPATVGDAGPKPTPQLVKTLKNRAKVGDVNLDIYTGALPLNVNFSKPIGKFRYSVKKTTYAHDASGPYPVLERKVSDSYPVFYHQGAKDGLHFAVLVPRDDGKKIDQKVLKKEIVEMEEAHWLMCTSYIYTGKKWPEVQYCGGLSGLGTAPLGPYSCPLSRPYSPSQVQCSTKTLTCSALGAPVVDERTVAGESDMTCNGSRVPVSKISSYTNMEMVDEGWVEFPTGVPFELEGISGRITDSSGRALVITEKNWSFAIPEPMKSETN